MRLLQLFPVVALLSVSPALVQEWTDFTSKVDRFTVNLPGEPKVQEIKWQSEYDAVFGGRSSTSDTTRQNR
jgi:hypothetical protein